MTAGIKIAIFLCFAILIGVLFYLFDWQPKMAELKNLDSGPEGIGVYTTQRDELKNAVQDLEEYEKQLKEAEAQLARFNVAIDNPQDFVPSYLEEIEILVKSIRTSMNDWDFEIGSISLGNPSAGGAQGGGPSYNTYTVSMSTAGRLETLQRFLQALSDKEKFKKLVVVNGISLVPKAGGLAINLPLTAYQFTAKGGVQ